MFEHLDDPAPPIPDGALLKTVSGRIDATRRRQRLLRAAILVSVVIVITAGVAAYGLRGRSTPQRVASHAPEATQPVPTATAVPTTVAASAATGTPATSTTTTSAVRDQALPGERLSATVTYDRGLKRFDPPPPSVYATRSSRAAYQACVGVGRCGVAPGDRPTTIQFALYTEYGTSAHYVRHAVWLLTWENVSGGIASGGGHIQGSTPPSTSDTTTTTTNEAMIVDDATGTAIADMNGRPD